MISDEKVGPKGVKVRCKRCGNVVLVTRPPSAAPEPAPHPAPAHTPRPDGSPETTLERELGNAFQSAFTSSGARSHAAEAAAPQAAASAEAPAGAEAFSDWYVAVNDRQVGPLPAPGVKARWEAGEIGPDTLAWRPGMADWVALSTITEMAQYLAPVPRGVAKPAPSPAAVAEARMAAAAAAQTVVHTPAAAAPSPSPVAHASHGPINGVSNGVNGAPAAHAQEPAAWKPSAASALAALANEEIASVQQPAKKAPAPEPKASTLVDRMGLPDGGVDPTNIIPLPIKGLDATGETALKARAASAPAAPAQARRKREPFTISGVGLIAVVAGALAIYFGIMTWLRSPIERPTPPQYAQAPVPPPAAAAPPPVQQQPAPPPVAPPPVAAAPAPEPAPAPAPAAPAPAAVAQPAPVPPAVAQDEQEPSPPPAAAPPPRTAPAPVRTRPHRSAAAEVTRLLPKRTRVASSRPAPAPESAPAPPPRRRSGGDPLLDVDGSGGDDLDRELSGKAPKRSVYVPPAVGADVPENVSVSQISEAVAGRRTALVHCTEQQRSSNPDVSGTLKLRWVITGDGSVREVRVLSDEFARQPIASCISGVVKSIRFPRSRTTGQEVVFPFKF
jgi:hypothetical protein